MIFWILKHFIMEVFIHREVERNVMNTSLPTTHFNNCCCRRLVAQLYLTPGTAAHQGSMSPSIYWSWNQTCVSCNAGGFFTADPLKEQTLVNYLSSINWSSIWSICLSLYSSLYSIYLMIHLKVNALACISSSRIQ